MPTYEFRCADCRKRYEIFLSFADYDGYKASCPHCSSTNVARYIRKVRFSLGDRSRLATLADPDNLNALESDPQALGKMMREMKTQLGANDLPGEFDEVVNRLERGQSPDEIERDLPELSDDAGGGTMDVDLG
jgi:putative FmdB family regulatory protein